MNLFIRSITIDNNKSTVPIKLFDYNLDLTNSLNGSDIANIKIEIKNDIFSLSQSIYTNNINEIIINMGKNKDIKLINPVITGIVGSFLGEPKYKIEILCYNFIIGNFRSEYDMIEFCKKLKKKRTK